MKPKFTISSPSNAQVKNLVLLQKKAKARDEQGIFVIEGIKMFEEAKALGLIIKAYASESFYQDIIKDEPKYFDGIEYELLTDSVFKEVAETKTPQGVLATVKQAKYQLEDLLKAPDACLLLLEDIRDPGNMGTMIRTAEGAGVTGIIFGDSTVDIYNPKVIRSTMGSIYRMPFYQVKDFYNTIPLIKEQGITVFAAHLLGSSYDSEDYFKGKCAFLIGNEANGLSERAVKEADKLIKIPMAGQVESLNAAIAAAILMYEAARQRRLS